MNNMFIINNFFRPGKEMYSIKPENTFRGKKMCGHYFPGNATLTFKI